PEIFDEFIDTPIGIGSVSQVYKARLKNGEFVAVKIQYPEMSAMVKQDIAYMSLICKLVRRFNPTINFDQLIEIIKQALAYECDFLNEAAAYERIRQIFAGDDKYIIPKVFHDLCTPRVLVMELINGQKFYDFVENAAYAERCRAFHLIFQFQYKLLFLNDMLQLDVHPGNFLFTDGRLICLDLGFNLKILAEDSKDLHMLKHGIFGRDPKRLFTIFIELGYLDGNSQKYSAEIEKWIQKLINMFFLCPDDIDPIRAYLAIYYEVQGNLFFKPKSLVPYFLLYSNAYSNGILSKLNVNTEEEYSKVDLKEIMAA
ncbi:MAG: hypothetical protein HQK54_18295, partial [Oligoflexales bacterium]|nr:hypothetical protein [Oligoflexales bacterium]